MFVIVWQFDVEDSQVDAFQRAYGSEGDWARLFRRSPAYRGTELLVEARVPGRFLTVDRWDSEESFIAFRRNHDAEYEALDRQCDSLTAQEQRIGAYRVAD